MADRLATAQVPNDNVNPLTALTAEFTPSVTLNVKVNVVALVAWGVIVNTLSAFATVVPFNEPAVTLDDHVKAIPSGSVATAVIVVAVPSVAKLYAEFTPVIEEGEAFVTSATRYQPTPFHIYNLFVALTNAVFPLLVEIAGKSAKVS